MTDVGKNVLVKTGGTIKTLITCHLDSKISHAVPQLSKLSVLSYILHTVISF